MSAPDALRDAVENVVREQSGDSHVVTDYLVVAAHIDMGEGPGRVAYTTVPDGSPHSIVGLLESIELGNEEGDA